MKYWYAATKNPKDTHLADPPPNALVSSASPESPAPTTLPGQTLCGQPVLAAEYAVYADEVRTLSDQRVCQSCKRVVRVRRKRDEQREKALQKGRR